MFLAVAELDGRVSVLDQNNASVIQLGDNPDAAQWSNFSLLPVDLHDGVFTAPHGIAWDRGGNLYVEEWNWADDW
jgi:DNA-binding beta-propeller fold protein YncE